MSAAVPPEPRPPSADAAGPDPPAFADVPPAPADVPPAFAAPLAYDTPLAAGRVRPHRPGDGSLVVDVGPLPPDRQLLAVAPLAGVFALLCVEVTALLYSLLWRPGTIPIDKLLLLPSALVWAFVGLELVLQLREGSAPVRLTVAGGAFAFPYPWPRSPVEQLRADDVAKLGVVVRRPRALGWRPRILRRRRAVLEVRLRQGATFALLPGYPPATLEEVCDLLGPALGLAAADGGADADADADGGRAGDSAGGRPPAGAG